MVSDSYFAHVYTFVGDYYSCVYFGLGKSELFVICGERLGGMY